MQPSPIVLFTRRPEAGGGLDLDPAELAIHAPEADPAALPAEARFFLVDLEEESAVRALVDRLHQDPRHCLTPLFLLRESAPPLVARTDGVVTSIAVARRRAGEIREILQTTAPERTSLCTGLRFRLLAYLYSRDLVTLDAVRDWTHPQVYAFPIAESLTGLGETLDGWLAELVHDGLLRREGLTDRLRLCGDCGYAHLNYVDVCPHCGDKDIRRTNFLHCFTCGTVAPEQEFAQGIRLVCPHCGARLRHIGADYDRALEEYRCAACHAVFAEPEVLGCCTHCGHSRTPAELPVRTVHRYGLTEKGVVAVRTGRLESVSQVLDRLQTLSQEHFLFHLDWMIAYNRRYQDEVFSLLGIGIANVEALLDAIGQQATVALAEEYVRRLRGIIRDTDLVTRSGLHQLWLLCPRTDDKGRQVLESRIREKTREMTPEDAERLRLDFAGFTSSRAEGATARSARSLFDHLRAQLEDATNGDGSVH